MCGRYVTNSEEELTVIKDILMEISIYFKDDQRKLETKQEDIYPKKQAPIIYLDQNQYLIDKASFGFNHWNNKSQVIFNARLESINQSYFFKSHLNNRCIIIAKGYYEWKTNSDNSKTRYYFYNPYSKTSELENGFDSLYFMGIYNKQDNQFAIITKEASQDVAKIHHRMPLMIDPVYIDQWLLGDIDINDLDPKYLTDVLYYQG